MPAGGEHLGERGQLGAVAHHRAGAVGLDEADVAGLDAGLGVGAAHRPLLAVLAGRGQAQAAAVGGGADRPHDRVDAVAVALGVGQPLEHHAGHALAERDAVGVGVERAALARGRQGVDAGEQQEVLHAVVEVGAPAQHHVAAAGGQLDAGRVQRGQRRGAGRVDREVLAPQVEAVGDAAGDDVGEQARGTSPRRSWAATRPARAASRPGRTGNRARKPWAVGLVGAALGAEDDRGPLPVEGPLGVAGVGQGVGRHLEAEQLGRLDGRQRGGRDAVGQGVEGDVGQEAAPLARRCRVRWRRAGVVPVGVEVASDVPALGRDLGDRVDARPRRCARTRRGRWRPASRRPCPRWRRRPAAAGTGSGRLRGAIAARSSAAAGDVRGGALGHRLVQARRWSCARGAGWRRRRS